MDNKSQKSSDEDDEAAAAINCPAHVLPIRPFLAEYVRNKLAQKQEHNEHAGHRERLRDSAKQDLRSFSDVELVELLLSFFIPQKDTNVIAHKLLDRYGSVAGVLSAPKTEIIQIANITAQAASMMDVMFEMCKACGQKQFTLHSCGEAAEFFALAYLSKLEPGTYAAFIDRHMVVRAIECYAGDGLPTREIINSACK